MLCFVSIVFLLSVQVIGEHNVKCAECKQRADNMLLYRDSMVFTFMMFSNTKREACVDGYNLSWLASVSKFKSLLIPDRRMSCVKCSKGKHSKCSCCWLHFSAAL